LKRLFASGANPCETDEFGCTPLHYAAMNGFVEVIEICCINDRGTDPYGRRSWALQQQTSAGWTALHVAVVEGKNAVECVRALLAMGSDPWVKDLEGCDVFAVAGSSKNDAENKVVDATSVNPPSIVSEVAPGTPMNSKKQRFESL